MSTKSILEETVGGATMNAACFDGNETRAPGMVVLSFDLWHGDCESRAEVRAYCRAADLRRLACAFDDAAALAEEVERTGAL